LRLHGIHFYKNTNLALLSKKISDNLGTGFTNKNSKQEREFLKQ